MDSIAVLANQISKGNRIALAKGITLVESKNVQDFSKANFLLKSLQPIADQKTTIRLAISGAPGVGKSTLIETLGAFLIGDKGHRIAVLSIDPSSGLRKGSILGDKTRMQNLSNNPHAYIRPSAAGDFLGGIAWRTQEAILLCEAAGFDIILIETVGVGQSEFRVKEMVDAFVLLLQPGSGDELQGIKRGIMEMADLLCVNKVDGGNKELANTAFQQIKEAIAFLPKYKSGWKRKVLKISGQEGMGIEELYHQVLKFIKASKEGQQFQKLRNEQKILWLKERVLGNFQNILTRKLNQRNIFENANQKLLNDEADIFSLSEEITKQVRFNFESH